MPSRASSLFFFQAEDGIRDLYVTGVQTCALPISTQVAAAPVPEPPEAGADAEAAQGPAPVSAVQPEEVHEVDLSDEWATMLEPQEAAAPPPPAPKKSDEKVAAKKSPAVPKAPSVEEFEVPLGVPAEDEEEVANPSAAKDKPVAPEPAAISAKDESPVDSALSVDQPPARSQAEPEFELDQEYELVLNPEPLVPAYDQKPPAAPANSGGMASDQFLADLANEIDQLGIDELKPSFSEPADRKSVV